MGKKLFKKQLTLTIIHRHPKVLLGMKKRGFGKGKWNGFGGKVGLDETVEQAAKRELLEEAGVKAGKVEKMGILEFEFSGEPEILQVHIFKAKEFFGKPRQSEEMKPKWFDTEKIPFEKMWPDDIFWMPLFLEGKKFRGKFLFGNQEQILKQELEQVESL